MNSVYRYFKYVLMLAILLLIGAKYHHFKYEASDADSMAARLAPFKQLLKNHKTVGFYTNIAPADSALKVYYMSQFLLQPVIVKEQAADTILAITDPDGPAKTFTGYKTLVTGRGVGVVYSLIKKDN